MHRKFCFYCCTLNSCGVKCFFLCIFLSMVLVMNFFSNCCFVKNYEAEFTVLNLSFSHRVPSGDVLVTVSTKFFGKKKPLRIKIQYLSPRNSVLFWNFVNSIVSRFVAAKASDQPVSSPAVSNWFDVHVVISCYCSCPTLGYKSEDPDDCTTCSCEPENWMTPQIARS